MGVEGDAVVVVLVAALTIVVSAYAVGEVLDEGFGRLEVHITGRADVMGAGVIAVLFEGLIGVEVLGTAEAEGVRARVLPVLAEGAQVGEFAVAAPALEHP